MKRITAIILAILLSISSFASCKADNSNLPEQKSNFDENNGQIRAVWLNYNELAMNNCTENSEKAFKAKITQIIQNCSDYGFNRIIVQVRPFCDAFYNSSIFPQSAYLSGTQGESVGYDALKIIVDCATVKGIKVDAWVNPFRVAYDTDTNKLSETNPARNWLESGDDRNVIVLENGIYLNPAKTEVRKLVLDGIREIIENYKVDGVHIDDYFYPTTDESFDSTEYNEYLQQGGLLSLSDWRRENINNLVSQIYATVKAYDENLLFSVSPCGDIDKNYNNYYADVKLWCSQDGYADVIMPQLYYGFENEQMPFEKVFNEWVNIKTAESVKLCIGLAYYKYAKEDIYAGVGINEWVENNDIITRQIKIVLNEQNCNGFALYSYSFLFDEKLREFCNNELQNIKNMI